MHTQLWLEGTASSRPGHHMAFAGVSLLLCATLHFPCQCPCLQLSHQHLPLTRCLPLPQPHRADLLTQKAVPDSSHSFPAKFPSPLGYFMLPEGIICIYTGLRVFLETAY